MNGLRIADFEKAANKLGIEIDAIYCNPYERTVYKMTGSVYVNGKKHNAVWDSYGTCRLSNGESATEFNLFFDENEKS